MRTFSVQYKDSAGFVHFVPTNGSLPIYTSADAANKALDTLKTSFKGLLKGNPIYGRTSWFGRLDIIGYEPPPTIDAMLYRQIVNTIHIGVINIVPSNRKHDEL